MSEKTLVVCPVIEPIAAGVIGLGIGYSLAPKKYSLKDLLLLEEDKFEAIYSKDLASNMSLREQISLQSLKNARHSYKKSRHSLHKEIKIAAKNWVNEFKQVYVPENLKIEFKVNKSNLQQAIRENNYIELNKKYRAAKDALRKSPDDEMLKANLSEANINLSQAKAIISSKIELYKDSIQRLQEERLNRIKNEPLKYTKVKEAYKNFLKVLSDRRTAASNKLFELTNDKTLLKTFETLGDYLPKARTKSALSGALFLASFTALLTIPLTKSSQKRGKANFI